MALELTKKIAMSGKCVIDGTVVETYSATIDTENPKSVRINPTVLNQDLRKENHDTCIQAQYDFEKAVYEEQDRMIADLSLSV